MKVRKCEERFFIMTNDIVRLMPAFGYEIIRDQILNSILGKHEKDVLYWAGKEVARKYPLFSIDEVSSFFNQAGWGDIILEKETKESLTYVLTGDDDLLKFEQRCFRLEAGFLAQQVQKLNGYLTECYEEVHAKKESVTFTVKWDSKEPVNK